MAFDPEKEGAIEIFDPVAEGAVALQEPQRLDSNKAFEKAGEVWDISAEQEIPLSDADRGFIDVQEVKRKHDRTSFWFGTYSPIHFVGPPFISPFPVRPIKTLAEVPKGVARFLQRDFAGGFGGTMYDWLGQLIQQGGAALDWWTKVGSKNKDQIYNPFAEVIIATGENISKEGREAREFWAVKAATGWEAFDTKLRETDPISYGAGRISESLTSSALAVLAAYLSGGATLAPIVINAGHQINRGLVALSLLSAMGSFEHAQNQDENFYWSTVHGIADGGIEYAMESFFLKDVGKNAGVLLTGGKEALEEFFTGMIQNTRAGILENVNKGMGIYQAAKKAVISSLKQSPWEVAAGFIGGTGIAGGANLVQLVEKSVVKLTEPPAVGIKPTPAAIKVEKPVAVRPVGEITPQKPAVKPEISPKPPVEKEVIAKKPQEVDKITEKARKVTGLEAVPKEFEPLAEEARKAPTAIKFGEKIIKESEIRAAGGKYGFKNYKLEIVDVRDIKQPKLPDIEDVLARSEGIKDSIQKGEFIPPIQITKAGKILNGNARLEAYKALGIDKVPVIRIVGDGDGTLVNAKEFFEQAKPPAAVTEGEAATLEDVDKPTYGSKNTLVSTEEYLKLKAEESAEELKGEDRPGFRKGAARVFTPEDIVRAGKIGLYHFEAGLRQFKTWSAQMIKEFGESIKPHLKKTWDNINAQQIPTKEERKRLKKKERGFVTSVKGALPELKVEGTYIPRSTDALSIKARNLVKEDIKQAEQVALKGNSDKSVAVASELLKHYSEQAALAPDQTTKDVFYDKAATIASDIAAKLTESGSAMQAAIILTRLTPEGQVRFAAREIQKYNEKIDKSKGGLFGLKKKVPELTPKQAEEILTEMKAIEEMPPGTEKAKRFQKLQNKISDMVPTSLFQKMIAVWKAGLLTGIKTTGLNITANVSHVATETVAKIPAVMLDKMVAVATGARSVAFTMKGLGKGVVTGSKRGVDYLVTGYDERDIGTKLDYKRKSFGKGKTARALQAYTDGIFRLLGAEDQPFYYAAKLRSLYEQAKVSAINAGLKGKKAQAYIDNLMENPTEDMIKNASKDAESAVFQNKTALGDLAKGIQGLGKGAGEIIVPFGRTPSAVAMQIINYSPVGAVKTILENIGKGKFNQRDFVTGLGRSIVGAIPLVIGAALWDNDMLTLDFPKTEKERKLWEIEVRKANSIKVDGKWRTIQSFGPAGNLLVVGGHFRRAFTESGSPAEAMATALAGSAKSFTEQTFLQGINQFSAALNDPERSGPRLARGLVSSVIPTIVGDVARATDPLERRTGSIAGRVKAKIPGLRQTLEPRVTVLGEEVKATANPLEIMIDPTRPSKEIKSPVIKELRRLFDAGHKVTPSLLGSKEGFEILTQQENTALWKRTGQLISESLNIVITNPSYKDWNDEAKASIIDRIVDASKTAAKAEVVAKKLRGLKGNELMDKLIELNEVGLTSSDLFPTKEIERLKGTKK